MGIRLFEHKSYFLNLLKEDMVSDSNKSDTQFLHSTDFDKYQFLSSKPFNKSSFRYIFNKSEDQYEIKADYCIGIDWLGNTGKYIYVEPKLNSSFSKLFTEQLEDEDLVYKEDDHVSGNQVFELDYLTMLLQVTSAPESNNQVGGLVLIDWDIQQIEIEQKDDKLIPFLIVRFLQTLKLIVRKGLKKNYYKVQENLNNRIKGKILVGQHIKQNVFKNRFTSTSSEYQVFGEDHIENRFLKKVLRFVASYVENHKGGIDESSR